MPKRIKVALPDGRLGIVLKDGPDCSNKVIVKKILDQSPMTGKLIQLGSVLDDVFPDFKVLNLVFRFMWNQICRKNFRRGRHCWC